MTTERNKVLMDASASFKDRYQAMQNYERAVVKNLKPMIGPHGDNETAAQFINGAIKRRTELFGSDVTRNAASASELLDRSMAYRPPAPQQPAAGTGEAQGFIGRAKEAIGVARDLVDLTVGGAKKSVDMDSIHSGAANLARPGGRTGVKEIDASLRSVPVVVNGKIDEGGRVRSMTDADRRNFNSFKDQIGLRQNDKGGDVPRRSDLSNFLATDEVPETLFGIPVVASPEQYTESDLAFFEEHPRAGGFYELGDEDTDTQAATGAGDTLNVESDRHARTRGKYPGSLNNPGNIEKRKARRTGEVTSPHKRWAKFATPQDGLREMADVLRQIAVTKLWEDRGQDFTIRNFAEIYAPRYNDKGEIENDTDKYIADISKDSGFEPDEELPRWDNAEMGRLLRSIVKFESGAPHSAWFTEKEYEEAGKKLQEGAFE